MADFAGISRQSTHPSGAHFTYPSASPHPLPPPPLRPQSHSPPDFFVSAHVVASVLLARALLASVLLARALLARAPNVTTERSLLRYSRKIGLNGLFCPNISTVNAPATVSTPNSRLALTRRFLPTRLYLQLASIISARAVTFFTVLLFSLPPHSHLRPALSRHFRMSSSRSG